MSTRDIQEQIKELYNLEISSKLVSKISEKIMPQVNDNVIKIKTASCAGEDASTTGDIDTNKELLKQVAKLYFNLTGRMCNANDYVNITQVIELSRILS